MDNKRIAQEIVAVARELQGSLGYDTTIDGGNIGGNIRFTYHASFPSLGLSDIAQMMKSFKSRVDSYIIKKIPAKLRSSGDVRMSSQGDSSRDIALSVSYGFEWKKQGVLEATIQVLEDSHDVSKLTNYVR